MTSRAHRPARILAVLALTAPMAVVLVGSTASPAAASTTTSSVSLSPNQSVFTSPTQVSVKGTITYKRSATEPTRGGGGDFYVYGPDGYSINQPINSCDTGLATSCSSSTTLTVSSSAMSSRSNGAWPVKIKGATEATFYTNFKPTADPANLAAAASGRTQVDLSWSYSGSEPDKAGFEIVETHNGSTRTVTAPASACSGSTCGYSLTYPQPAEATTADYSYTVTARREACGNASLCGDYTRSAPSSSASAQLVGPPPPPSPTPTPSQSTGGTTGGTTGSTTGGSTGSTPGSTTGSTPGSTGSATPGSTSGSTPGSTTGTRGGTTGGTTGSAAKPITIPTLPPIAASRRAFALGFNRFSPSLGIPKLPPLPATTFPVTAPAVETYQPTLPYDAEARKTTKVLSSPIAQITQGIDTEQLAKSLAVALILLVAAAHVRIFLSHSSED